MPPTIKYIRVAISSILLLSTLGWGQDKIIQGRFIVRMADDYAELPVERDGEDKIRTGLPSLDQLNAANNCLDIRKLYSGPSPDAAGLYIFSFSEDRDI